MIPRSRSALGSTVLRLKFGWLFFFCFCTYLVLEFRFLAPSWGCLISGYFYLLLNAFDLVKPFCVPTYQVWLEIFSSNFPSWPQKNEYEKQRLFCGWASRWDKVAHRTRRGRLICTAKLTHFGLVPSLTLSNFAICTVCPFFPFTSLHFLALLFKLIYLPG